MSNTTQESLTPESSAVQSFGSALMAFFGYVRRQRTIFDPNQVTRMRVALLALLVTLAANFLWLSPDGYSGFSAFIVLSTLVLFVEIQFLQNIGSRNLASLMTKWAIPTIVVLTGVVVGCVRMIWQGNHFVAVFTLFLLVTYPLLSRSRTVGVLQGMWNWFRPLWDGVCGWGSVFKEMPWLAPFSLNRSWIAWAMPVGLGLVFLVPLISAHPELLSGLWYSMMDVFDWLNEWLVQISFVRLLISIGIAIAAFGLMVPAWITITQWVTPTLSETESCSDLRFQTCRNCLIVVIAVFAVFLIVELNTLWFHDFEAGFDYSAYAHQGAAWLVIALMMSTLTMSVIFVPTIQAHPQFELLKKLAWIWFAANLLLVVAVYHRLGIYVQYDGLTRLRIVGYIGVSCVLAGFVMVMFRVTKMKSVRWLIHWQAWAFFVSLFALSVLPMDYIAMRYNVGRIQAGDKSPLGHLLMQPISTEGLIALAPLLDSPHSEISNYIKSIVAEWQSGIERNSYRSRLYDSPDYSGSFDAIGPPTNWRQFQWAEQQLRTILDKHESEVARYRKSRLLREQAESVANSYRFSDQ